MKKEEKLTPVYIMVPRKLVIGWISSFLVTLIMASAAIQWANYVDRRSNQRWCGIVTMYNREFAEHPPPSTLGQQLVIEFKNLRKEFSCK